MKEKLTKKLNNLQEKYEKFNTELDKFCELIRDFFDTPLIESAFEFAYLVLDDIAEELGLDSSKQESDILYQWVIENEFGKYPMNIMINEEEFLLNNNEEFIEFMISITEENK